MTTQNLLPQSCYTTWPKGNHQSPLGHLWTDSFPDTQPRPWPQAVWETGAGCVWAQLSLPSCNSTVSVSTHVSESRYVFVLLCAWKTVVWMMCFSVPLCMCASVQKLYLQKKIKITWCSCYSVSHTRFHKIHVKRVHEMGLKLPQMSLTS